MDMNFPLGVQVMDQDRYVELARNHPEWQAVKASFALEGIALTVENEVIAGRMIAGELSLQDALIEIRRQHGVRIKATDGPFLEVVQ